MCGITGYIGTDDCVPIVQRSLANLEYRGYDSAGIAVDNGELQVFKRAGRVDDLTVPTVPGVQAAIGHTRWSTHGEPTDENAHPHTDCTGELAVVHNGIIENFDALREELEARHKFESDTDTEVVPHLLEDELADGADLREAVDRVVERLSGSYALVVRRRGDPCIVGARQDSPLVVGHAESGNFLASDVPAFIEYTRTVTYLEDGDVVELTADGVEVFRDGRPVAREPREVEWDAEAAEKGGYEHYMLKEIHEQPRALRQAISGRVDELAGEVALDLSFSSAFVEGLEEVQFVAAGTSYHAGLYAAAMVESLADVRATTAVASEYAAAGGRDPDRTLVVAISQSGETADTLGAVRRASATGATTLAVTNTVGSSLTRAADETIYIRAGPEIGVAATKTYGTQVAVLALLAAWLGRARGALSSADAEGLLEDIGRLPGAVQQALDREERVREVAEEYADSDAFFFIGRRLGHAVALEGALKLKEISYDHAEGFPAGELKHGPLALVTPETTVIALLTEGAAPKATLNSVKEVETRGASVIGLSTDTTTSKFVDTTLRVPDVGDLSPVVANVHQQLFAYHVARLSGRSIDKPRNLAKSVTVE